MIEIWVAFVTGVFGALAAWIAARRKTAPVEILAAQQKEEIDFRADALTLKIELSKWSSINQEIRRLMLNTNIDRFFILNAFNGYHDPKWTTAVYQIQKDDRTLESYVDFGIDTHYIGLLKKVRTEGVVSMHADDLPASLIKAVYHTEGVLSSEWYYICDKKLDTGAVGMTYCTFSSRAGVIGDDERDKCLVLANKIRSVLT